MTPPYPRPARAGPRGGLAYRRARLSALAGAGAFGSGVGFPRRASPAPRAADPSVGGEEICPSRWARRTVAVTAPPIQSAWVIPPIDRLQLPRRGLIIAATYVPLLACQPQKFEERDPAVGSIRSLTICPVQGAHSKIGEDAFYVSFIRTPQHPLRSRRDGRVRHGHARAGPSL
jgi:hypothetical protein